LLLAMCGCAAWRLHVPLVERLASSPTAPIFWTESFDALRPESWRDVEVQRKTQYDVVELEGRRCLRAQSRDGASILLSAVQFDPGVYEWFSWEWRVDQHVAGESLERKEGSDVAARVYVYFDTAGLPWQKRSLDYVWSATLPVGTILESAYSSSSQIIVAESGAAHLGQWRTVERNLKDDYQHGFGKSKPPHVVAIGLMSDTDNTQGEALAYFDELRVTREPTSSTRGR